jgi:hypothetical protein
LIYAQFTKPQAARNRTRKGARQPLNGLQRFAPIFVPGLQGLFICRQDRYQQSGRSGAGRQEKARLRNDIPAFLSTQRLSPLVAEVDSWASARLCAERLL